MSVYTQLNLPQIHPLLKQLGCAEATDLQPIKGGIENSNFFVTLVDGREAVLTLFEELDIDQAAFLGPLLKHLAGKGIPVAAPFHDAQGKWLHTLLDKPVQVAPRLRGQHPMQPTVAQCHSMGKALAALHAALRNYPLKRSHAHGARWWAEVAARWQPKLTKGDATLLAEVFQRYAALLDTLSPTSGLIHGDLFRDNVLFEGDDVSGILDFSECSEDHLLLDIAVTANDFCRQWPSDTPDDARLNAFLAGYQQVLPLSDTELVALPVFLAVAAMRFWLSRLEVTARNQSEQRQGVDILQKDPEEMRQLLIQRLAKLS